ncbi:MAG: hypothetical protein ACK4SO_04260, partial [Candidatus Kapaibacteriota bacterium]
LCIKGTRSLNNIIFIGIFLLQLSKSNNDTTILMPSEDTLLPTIEKQNLQNCNNQLIAKIISPRKEL